MVRTHAHRRLTRALAAVGAAVLTLSACGEAGAGVRGPDAAAGASGVLAERGPRAFAMAGTDGSARAEPLPIGTGWGPTEQQIERARRLVGELTLRQRAGQVIVARYAGTAPPSALVNRLHLGGVIVFAENYAGTGQIRRSNAAVQSAARKAGRAFPVTIGVDQEGGRVERVTGGTRFPAFMTAGAAGRPGLTRRAASASGAELAGLGFTHDFAPVADVTVGPADPTIGARAASSRPRVVARHAVAAARGYLGSGVVPTVKHFPGHGSVTADSHLTLPVQRRSRERLDATDLVPFRAAVDAGLPSVMVGHIDVRAVDPGTPSSLSRPVVTGLLREELGFDGVVVTDSLVMRAVARRWSSGPAAVRVLRAGGDVVLMPGSPREARDAIARAVREGRLSSARLVQAATRQVALLLHQRSQGSSAGAVPGTGAAVSHRWSAAALTSVSGPCRGRLVGSRVRVSGAATEVSRFRTAAQAAGLRLGRRGTTVHLVGSGGGPARGDVVVATDRPYVLGESRARTRLATYGTTPGAMRALVDVLLGRATAPGTLPVPVRGLPRRGC